MTRDWLMPPVLPLRPPLQSAASNASASSTAPVSIKRQGLSLSRDPNVPKERTRSFFPCMTAVCNNVRRLLHLRRPSAQRKEKLPDAARKNRDTYKCFRMDESMLRKSVFGQYSDCFRNSRVSDRPIGTLHKKFHGVLNRRLAESFRKVLRAERDQHPERNFPDALGRAYKSIYTSVINELSAKPHIYPVGYTDTLKDAMRHVACGLGLDSQFSPRDRAPDAMPVSRPAPKALVTNRRPSEVARGRKLMPITSTLPGDHLSKDDCTAFKDEVLRASAAMFSKHTSEAGKAGLAWQKIPILAFQLAILKGSYDLVRNTPPNGTSIAALHDAHHAMLGSAVEKIITEQIPKEEICSNKADMLRKTLSDICNGINLRISKGEDPRMASLLLRPPADQETHSLKVFAEIHKPPKSSTEFIV